MFEVNSIKEVETGTLDVINPSTGAKMDGTTLTLAGPNHPTRKALEFNRARVLRARVNKKGKFEMTDPQEDEDYEIDRLVACTTGWTGFVRDGNPIQCTDAEKRAIYEHAAWLRKQVSDFLDDPMNFIKSAKTA